MLKSLFTQYKIKMGKNKQYCIPLSKGQDDISVFYQEMPSDMQNVIAVIFT